MVADERVEAAAVNKPASEEPAALEKLASLQQGPAAAAWVVHLVSLERDAMRKRRLVDAHGKSSTAELKE